jgi:hypothetical protein
MCLVPRLQEHKPIVLTKQSVDGIQLVGGTILGTSRGGANIKCAAAYVLGVAAAARAAVAPLHSLTCATCTQRFGHCHALLLLLLLLRVCVCVCVCVCACVCLLQGDCQAAGHVGRGHAVCGERPGVCWCAAAQCACGLLKAHAGLPALSAQPLIACHLLHAHVRARVPAPPPPPAHAHMHRLAATAATRAPTPSSRSVTRRTCCATSSACPRASTTTSCW